MNACSRCGQEVRYGTRDGRLGWWHRELVDHNTRFGGPSLHPRESARLRNEWLVSHGEMTPEQQEAHVEPIPEPELWAEPVDDDGLPGGAKTIVSLARKAGWRVFATHSRGPWLHSITWQPTGIYDCYVVKLARDNKRAVATWRDGFQHGWTWTVGTPSLEKVNSTALKATIKEESDGQH